VTKKDSSVAQYLYSGFILMTKTN